MSKRGWLWWGGYGKGNASQQTHSGLAEVCVCICVCVRDGGGCIYCWSLYCTLQLGGWMLIRRHACLSWWRYLCMLEGRTRVVESERGYELVCASVHAL